MLAKKALPIQNMTKIARGLTPFLTHLIDYAGMFPPAKLDFTTAFSNYLDYQLDKDAWMMERFVFPIQSSQNIDAFSQRLKTHPKTVPLTVLPVQQAEYTDYLNQFHHDVEELVRAIEPFRIDARYFECKLPLSVQQSTQNEVHLFISQLLSISSNAGIQEPRFFIELSLQQDWKSTLETHIPLLKSHALSNQLGFKLRCGGITADAFPDAELIAHAIYLCKKVELPIKFTAGLHHPIRHYNESVQTKMYGFFNVFGASILAYAYPLSITEIQEILLDEKPEHFVFNESGMQWRELSVNTHQLNQARELFCTSYGSCSFDEPREDLHTLHLL